MARRQGQRDVDDAVWVECLTLNILSTPIPIPNTPCSLPHSHQSHASNIARARRETLTSGLLVGGRRTRYTVAASLLKAVHARRVGGPLVEARPRPKWPRHHHHHHLRFKRDKRQRVVAAMHAHP